MPRKKGANKDEIALTIDPNTVVLLDSFRIANHINASVHYLPMGKKARDVAKIQNSMFESFKKGSSSWFKDANGAKFFSLKTNGDLFLREELYYRPTPSILDRDLKLIFTTRSEDRCLRVPLNKQRLGFFSRLLPLLSPNSSMLRIREYFDSEELYFINQLTEIGFLKQVPIKTYESRHDFYIRSIGHATLLIETPSVRIIIDPLLTVRYRKNINNLFVLNDPLDAIVISHCHWDHFNLDSLLHVNRQTPLIFPKLLNRPSIVNLDMVKVAKQLGFRNIHILKPWEEIRIGDVKLISTPFYGEGSGPKSKQDWMTYYFEVGERKFFGTVDTCQDHFGSMDDVLEKIRRLFGQLDVLYTSCAGFFYPMNQFTRRPFTIEPKLEQFSPTPHDVVRWVSISGAKLVIPYSMFMYEKDDLLEDGVNDIRRGSIPGLRKILREYPEGPLCIVDPGRGIRWTPGTEFTIC